MKMSVSRRKYLLSFTTLLLAVGCVSTRLEPGRDHPASAQAETTPPAPNNDILASAPMAATPSNAPAAHAHDHAAPMADQYTCPMHPQVVKNGPGQCPICGMNLVKKEGAVPEGAHH